MDLKSAYWLKTICQEESMRNRILNVGIAIIALSGLPSCTTDSVDDANEVPDVGLAEKLSAPSEQAGEPSADVHAADVKGAAEPSNSEGARNGVIEDNAIAPLLSCGLNVSSDGYCYAIYNCHNYGIRRRIVKLSGGTTACFYIPPGGVLSDCLATGRVWYMEAC